MHPAEREKRRREQEARAARDPNARDPSTHLSRNQVKTMNADPRQKERKAEYKKTPAAREANADQSRIRREFEKKGLVHPGDGMQIDHRKPRKAGGTDAKSNLRVVTAHTNHVKSYR